MKILSMRVFRPSFGWNLLVKSAQFLRSRVSLLCLFIVLAWTFPVHAQITGLRDVFSYTTGTLNGHAPTTGTGVWSTSLSSGSNGAASISTNGTNALIKMNGGVTGDGQAIASYPFTPSANTLYTFSVAVNFSTTGSNSAGSWTGFGFSNQTFGQGSAGPWALVWSQRVATDNPLEACYIGHTVIQSGNVPAATFSGTSPVIASITWDTSTGLTKYYINNVLQATGTTALPSGTFYAFFQGFKTGNAISVKSVSLAAQNDSWAAIAMQDNFSYTSSSIAGQTPTTVKGGGWSTTWSVSNGNATISTSGSQAVILTNGGVPGSGSAVASFPFQTCPNTFYTLRIAFDFIPLGQSVDCWAMYGFSDSNNGKGTVGPGQLQRLQVQTTDNPASSYYIGNTVVASGSVPAAAFSAPVAATITWNTSTGETKYYVNDLLQFTGTTAIPNGQMYAYFQGFKTGNAVNVNTITLTAQQLPLPVVFLSPPNGDSPVNQPQWRSDFLSMFSTGTTADVWPTARDHTKALCIYDTTFIYTGTNSFDQTQWQSIVNYLKSNNIKLAVCIQPLVNVTGSSCTNQEGYSNPADTAKAITFLQTLGATVDYLTMDTPLRHGCELTGTWAPCNMPIATAAQQTADRINLFKAVWPNVKVIDLEGYCSIPAADAATWLADLQSILGKPIDGIQDDYNNCLNYPDQMIGVEQTCNAAGVPVGVILDGFSAISGTDNDAKWALGMKIDSQCFNASNVIQTPASVQIATWCPAPSHTTPDSNPQSLLGLLNMVRTSPYVMQAPPTPIHYVWKNSCYIITCSETEYLAWMASGYTDLGQMGGIFLDPNVGGVPGLVPLYRYYKSSDGRYALSLSTTDSNLTGQGFVYQNCQGYVFPPSTGLSLGGAPLYQYHASGTDSYLYDTNGNKTGLINDGIICYVAPEWMHYPPGQ